MTGLVCVAVAYLVLNVIWFARRALRRVDEHWVQPWTQEQAAQHLHRAARLLKITGILVLAGWFIMLPVFDRIGFAILWAVAAGTIICLGARRLAKNRDPGTVALILAMTPFSPAVVLGLPVGLSIMRMLSRPEIRELLKTKTEGQQTAEATV